MQFVISCSLLFDVLPDRIFVAMFSDGSCVVSICPEFAAPKLLLHVGTTPEYFSCGQAFYHRNNIGHTVPRYRLHQKMNMVLICSNFQELQLISFLDLQADSFQLLIHRFIKHNASVFRWKHQMVYQHSHIVAFMYIFAHIAILRRKRRGIQPQEINTSESVKRQEYR